MVKALIEAGTPPDLAAVIVTEAYAAGAASVQVSSGIPAESRLEKIRAADRERKRNKANSSGIPVESSGIHGKALTLTKKEKKVSKPKHPIPPEFQPSEDHFA